MPIAGCDEDPDNPAGPTEEPTVTDSQPTAATREDYRADQATRGLTDLAAVLASQGVTPRFGNAGFKICAGGEADAPIETAYAFSANGRADYPIGRGGTEAAARALVAALVRDGWTARNDGWAPGGIHQAGDDRWSVYVAREGGLQARVDLRAVEPIVLFAVSGPCLVPGAGAAPEVGSESVDLPGAVPLTDDPTEGPQGQLLPGR